MKKALYAASTAGHLRSFHLPWLHWLSEAGWTVHGAAAGPFSCPDLAAYYDLPFTKSLVSPKNLAVSWRLRGLLRQERYDLVLVHTSLAAFFVRLGVVLAGKERPRVVNVVHGYLFDEATPWAKRTLLLGAERLMKPVTDAVAVMNRQDLELAQSHHLSRGPVVLLPGMGVDFSRYAPAGVQDRLAARAAFGLPAQAFVLVYAAEFSRRKNQAFLVRALKKLPENVWLLLPGQGGLLDQVRKLAKALGLENRVLLPGFVTNMPACYHAGDLCVSSSRSEGLPFNLMEAMACGLPAVASRVKGHEDLIRPEQTGLIFDYDDEAAFCRAVTALMEDPSKIDRMGREARETVLSRYGLEQAAAVYTRLIESESGEAEA